ncbi:hypothetical protein VDGD_07956 [Verticillium dahliae]|nr:hypothetical protein VdG1_04276 [Verticillium dahliae VDG1]RBQ91160.1 hypothetical protein VDGD_07956 [Verticillium dahliae]
MGALGILKKVGGWFAPPPDKADDGRDVWPSRAAFLLASMGGCAGMGNLLRYPSQVYNNYGLQWFIPYLMAVFLIAIPVLILEIAIGQAFRGGSVIAFNNINQRLKGTGMGLLYIGFVVGPYFTVNLAWIMTYFRASFQSPLPWGGRGQEFFDDEVIRNPPPIPADESASGFVQYPHVGMLGETSGWMVFTWFLVWLCIFRGVGLTGRVVYFTMGLPIIMTIVLIGRSLSLDNAGEGVKLFWATWRGSELADGTVWQTACGQVFFSTGVGFGYFTSYASYNRKHSNAVVDAIAIVCSNVAFENIAAFAIYGVIGFARLWPEEGVRIGGFDIGFRTLPLAIVQMPGANFWAVALFFTLMTLGFSSAFAMLDAVVTMVMDSGIKLSRPIVVSALTLLSLLFSLPYCTEFGYYLLSGVDRWVNDVALVFVVWSECVTSTTIYRWKDVAGQIGVPAYAAYQVAYFGGQILGVTVAQAVSAEAGAGVGFGIYIVATVVALFIAKTPDVRPDNMFKANVFLTRFWYMAFYSANQLRRDLNTIVGSGKNWNIPAFWGPLVKYVAAPILAIVYSFSYPAFYAEGRKDPLHIFGFAVAHIVLIIIAAGFIAPRWFNVFIPAHRQNEGKIPYAPCVTNGALEVEVTENMEAGQRQTSDDEVIREKDSLPKDSPQGHQHAPLVDGPVDDNKAPLREEPLIR